MFGKFHGNAAHGYALDIARGDSKVSYYTNEECQAEISKDSEVWACLG